MLVFALLLVDDFFSFFVFVFRKERESGGSRLVRSELILLMMLTLMLVKMKIEVPLFFADTGVHVDITRTALLAFFVFVCFLSLFCWPFVVVGLHTDMSIYTKDRATAREYRII